MKNKKLPHNAVIGFPLGHSLSPVLHNAIYKSENINAEMKVYENKNVVELVKIIRDVPLELVAVTIPHKQAIMKLLDVVDKKAKQIGAVNTIINNSGVLTGYNTDIIGVEKALEGVELKNKNVLIIGAGGAAQSVAAAVAALGGNILCMNRTAEKAEKLVAKFGGQAVAFEEVVRQSIPIDVVVNTTPSGMKGEHENELPVPEEFVRTGQVVFDCVYNPFETKLIKLARERGARTISGLKMFVAQGLAQEELWLGRKIENKNYEELLKPYL